MSLGKVGLGMLDLRGQPPCDELLLRAPITTSEHARILLDRVHAAVPYASAMVTVYDPGRDLHVPLVNLGYHQDVVQHLLYEALPHDPALCLRTACSTEVLHWDNIAGFRSTYVARDVTMSQRHRLSTPLTLEDPAVGRVGTVFVSLEEETFPEPVASLMIALHKVLTDIIAAPRRRLQIGLSKREMEILGHVAIGLSNAEIAERLVLSRSTINTHVENILRKVGARNRVQAALCAVALGLVAPSDSHAAQHPSSGPGSERGIQAKNHGIPSPRARRAV